MPKTREQLEQIKRQRRSLILDAAAEIFCRFGYEFATIDQIAELAECSHGLLYHYFKTKDEIFYALIEYAGGRTSKLMKDILSRGDTPAQQLKALMDGLLTAIGEHDHYVYYFYFLTSLNVVKRDFFAKDAQRLPPVREHPHIHLSALIAEGQRLGELRSDATPDEYAHLFWAILQGYIMQMFTSRSVCRELRITLPGREILYRIFLNE